MSRLPPELEARLKTNRFRRADTYVVHNGVPLLSQTVCKRCGQVLSSVGPDPRIPSTRRVVKGTRERTVVIETYVSRLPSRESDSIEFEYLETPKEYVAEGGETRDPEPPVTGRYRTSICTPCKRELLDGVNDLAEVQELYDADLERIALADAAARRPEEATRRLIDSMISRRITKIIG